MQTGGPAPEPADGRKTETLGGEKAAAESCRGGAKGGVWKDEQEPGKKRVLFAKVIC